MIKQIIAKLKWGKKQLVVIDSGPYKQDIVVVINGHFRDALAFMEKQKTKGSITNVKFIKDHDKYEDNGFNVEHKANSGAAETWAELPHGYVVTLSHQDNWIDTTEIIVHECLHLTHYILRRAGVILSKESEEAFTYLQGYLVRQILDKMY